MLEQIVPKLSLIDVSQPYRDGFERWARAMKIDVVTSTAELLEPLDTAVLCVIETGEDAPELDYTRLLGVRKMISQAPVVVLANGMSLTAGVNLLKHGVRDVMELPLAVAEVVSRATAFVGPGVGTPLGSGTAAKQLYQYISEAAASSSTVLLTGETGTGKSVAARMIHNLSDRRTEPLIELNCGALSGSVVESELFGHERGSFTGATGARAGRFEAAGSGTILLDEIGELDVAIQVKLLRVLEERVFERVGGTRPRPMSARVIAATNKNLGAAMNSGDFRRDLFYRLNVIHIELPPLRDRVEDIPSLVHSSLEKLSERLCVNPPKLTEEVYERFAAHSWPGNIRELMNVLERVLISHQSGRFDEDSIGDWLGGPHVQLQPAPDAQVSQSAHSEFETYHAALSRTGGNNHAVARFLGVTIQTVRSKLEKYPSLAEHRRRLRAVAPKRPRGEA